MNVYELRAYAEIVEAVMSGAHVKWENEHGALHEGTLRRLTDCDDVTKTQVRVTTRFGLEQDLPLAWMADKLLVHELVVTK